MQLSQTEMIELSGLDNSESVLSTARFNALFPIDSKELEKLARQVHDEIEQLSQECNEVPADE